MHIRGISCLLTLSVLSLASAVNYVYDETLWTKRFWQDQWKLENPLMQLNPSGEAPKSQIAGISDSWANSLDGPYPRRDLSTANWEMLGLAEEALQDAQLVQQAAEAIQCQTCHVLLSKAWQKAVMSLLRGVEMNEGSIRSFLDEACEVDVVQGTLTKNAIYKMDADDGSTPVVFYVVRERKAGTTPGLVERQAVRHTCKELANTNGDEMAKIIREHLMAYRQSLEAVLRKHKLLSSPESADATDGEEGNEVDSTDADVVDGQGVGAGGFKKLSYKVDTSEAKGISDGHLEKLVKQLFQGLEVGLKTEGNQITVELVVPEDGDDFVDEDPCMDVHPKCRQWADEGECEANPKYMVGDAYQVGSCRKSCGVCTPRTREELESQKPVILTNPALSSELETVSTNLLQAVKNHACGSSKACLTGVTGTAANPGFVVKKASNPGGFVLGKPSYGIPTLVNVPADKLSSVTSYREGDESKEGGEEQEEQEDATSSDSSDGASSGDAHSMLSTAIDRLLGRELSGKFLRLQAEFFIYEYLYKNHTRHFHEDEKTGEITEDWLLGVFQRQSAVVLSGTTGEAAVLNPLDFIPELAPYMRQKSWPYVKQVYSGGEVCTLAGNKKVVRRTEARIACSPDRKLRFLVREPDFCRYIFVIYSPALCKLKEFMPKKEPTPDTAEKL